MTTAHCLQQVKEARDQGLTVPVILMGYTNPYFIYGEEKLIKDAKAAGSHFLFFYFEHNFPFSFCFRFSSSTFFVLFIFLKRVAPCSLFFSFLFLCFLLFLRKEVSFPVFFSTPQVWFLLPLPLLFIYFS